MIIYDKIKNHILVLNFAEWSEILHTTTVKLNFVYAVHIEILCNLCKICSSFARLHIYCLLIVGEGTCDHGVYLSKSTNRVHPANFP